MEQRKIGIWIRVSTEDQAQGISPELHEQRARAYCEAKGWLVATVYHLEAVSGKSVLEHPEAKRMMQDVKDGTITALVFSKLARLARNTNELLYISDFFQEQGAEIVSLQEAIDTSTPAGRLFYTIIAAMAQWEREEISSRVAASVPIRAKLGKPTGGAAPYGFQYKEDSAKVKRLAIDEQEAPIRKLMFELFAKYKRKKRTAAELNKLGYRTRSEAKFSDTTVDRLIRDTTAKGIKRSNYSKSRGNKRHWDLKPAEDWVFTECPAIVSEELWQECNDYLDAQYKKRRKPGRMSKHLLAGYVYCSCGNKMYVFHYINNKSYECKACKNRIPAEEMDRIYTSQLKHFLFAEQDVGDYRAHAEANLRERMKLLEASKSEELALGKEMGGFATMRARGELSQEDFLRHYSPLKGRLANLEEQIRQLKMEAEGLKVGIATVDSVHPQAKHLYQHWSKLTFENKRAIVEQITEQIVVDHLDISIKLAYLPTNISRADSGKRQRTVRGSWRLSA